MSAELRNHLPLDSSSDSEAEDDVVRAGKSASADDFTCQETLGAEQVQSRSRAKGVRGGFESTQALDDSVRCLA